MAQYTQDQAYTSGQDNDDTGVGKLRISATNNQIIGQSFTPATTGQCGAFAFILKRIGSPTGNVWVEIHADGADPTAATLLATSNTVNAVSGVLTGYDAVYFTFPTPPTLTSGTVYWALLYGDYSYGAAANVFIATDTSSPTYAGGSYGRYGNGGAAWETLGTYDTLFRQYVVGGTPINVKDKTGVNDIVYNSGVVASTSVPSTLSGARFSAEFSQDDRLTILDNSTIRIIGSVTVEGWMWNSGNEGVVLWNKYSPVAGNAGYSTYIQGDESMIFNASTDGSANWFRYTNSAVFDLNAWHHYAWVYDASGPTVYMYKDGVPVSIPNTSGTAGAIYASTWYAEMFNTSSSGVARLCDVRVWDTVKTSGEINANMNRFLRGNESHLVANYQFQPAADSITSSFFL